ncbi:MAG: thioesterase family protein, partial [Clostridiales bacterium]|nr:thioesterase family protein [Clostridiales bacterium]
MQTGTKGFTEILVTEENTARHMGSGTLDVFATPAMTALMERTAWESVQDQLDNGCCTVGTELNIHHLSATPVGMKVYCESELVEVNGRKLIFEVKAYDEAGLIGEGKHERVIVYSDRFQNKAVEKNNTMIQGTKGQEWDACVPIHD